MWAVITNWDVSRTPRRPQNNFTDIVHRFAENRQQQHDVNTNHGVKYSDTNQM